MQSSFCHTNTCLVRLDQRRAALLAFLHNAVHSSQLTEHTHTHTDTCQGHTPLVAHALGVWAGTAWFERLAVNSSALGRALALLSG